MPFFLQLVEANPSNSISPRRMGAPPPNPHLWYNFTLPYGNSFLKSGYVRSTILFLLDLKKSRNLHQAQQKLLHTERKPEPYGQNKQVYLPILELILLQC